MTRRLTCMFASLERLFCPFRRDSWPSASLTDWFDSMVPYCEIDTPVKKRGGDDFTAITPRLLKFDDMDAQVVARTTQRDSERGVRRGTFVTDKQHQIAARFC